MSEEKTAILSNVSIKVSHVGSEGIEFVAPYGWRQTAEVRRAFSDAKADRVWASDHWNVTLTYHNPRGDRSYTVPKYHTGIGHRKVSREAKGYYQGVETARKGITAKGVLECLFSDASAAFDTFDGWCSDLGYDTDSRKALETYLECQKTAVALRTLFGSDYTAAQEEINENA